MRVAPLRRMPVPNNLPATRTFPKRWPMSASVVSKRPPRANTQDVQVYLSQRSDEINVALDYFLPKEKVAPTTIHKAMRYSLFAGGKRMRPALCLAAAEACGGSSLTAVPLACAVECIHTYSLVHD